MSMTPRYLLSTATLPHGLAEEAVARGLVLDATDFIAVAPVAAEGMEALAGATLVAIFTSMNAVDAVLRQPFRPHGWKIYCMSGATYRKIAANFGDTLVAGTADSAEALAAIIRDSEQEKELYFFCGDKRREELPRILTAAGYRVIVKVVYRTTLTPQRIDREYAGIAFFSPSGVESYFSVNAVAGSTLMFAIGNSTATAIRSRCDNPVITAATPDKPLLVKQMIEHFYIK